MWRGRAHETVVEVEIWIEKVATERSIRKIEGRTTLQKDRIRWKAQRRCLKRETKAIKAKRSKIKGIWANH